jgi:hypothetical protein
VGNHTYMSTVETSLKIASPGVLLYDKDTVGYPLTVTTSSVVAGPGLTLIVDKNGGFSATVGSAGHVDVVIG